MGKCYGTEGPRSTSATFPEVASQLDRVVTFVSQGLDYRNLCIMQICALYLAVQDIGEDAVGVLPTIFVTLLKERYN